jgi:hypothetical protein
VSGGASANRGIRHRVTVTVADSHAADIDELADRLRQAGMDVDDVLRAIGIITGSVPIEQLSSIEALPGVAAVEKQLTLGIAPPDADVR